MLAGPRDNLPAAKSGIMDLASWDFEGGGPVSLRGEWEFHWRGFITPRDFGSADPPRPESFITLPSHWNGHIVNGTKLGPDGFATYRLRVSLPPGKHRLAVKFGEIKTAFALFINGALVRQGGVPGTDAARSTPGWTQNIAPLGDMSGALDIVLHVSNFHYYQGGIDRPLLLGLERDIFAAREDAVIIDLILFGILLVMGLYHLTVFLFRKQEMSLVYFSAFCLLVAVYLLTTGEVYFSRSFPARSWEALMVLVFLPIYLGAAVFSSFMRALFIEEFGPWPHRAFTALGIVFSAAVLALPARVHSQALPVFHAVLAALCAWSLYAIIRAIVNGRNNAWAFLAGVTAMIVAVANDILYYQNVVRTFDMAPFGVVALIFSQAVVLSRGFTEAHASAEKASEENVTLRQKLRSTEMARRGYSISAQTAERLDRAMAYIGEHYRQELSREGLASSIDMHPDTFSRLFRLYTGKRMGEYINELRVREAARLLREGDDTVLDIALSVGFESLRTFNRAFKSAMKTTAAEWRKNKET